MERVTGIGGIFFKAEDPKKLQAWYRDNLGVQLEEGGYAVFKWAENDAKRDAVTVWSTFSKDTNHFQPSKAPFMINYRVNNLDAMLAQLKSKGVEQVGGIEESTELGRFAWVMDPEGNKIELWQPPESK